MTSTYTRKSDRTYRYYVCAKASKYGYDSCPVKTVAAGEIEQAVISQIRTIFRSPEMIAQTYLAAKRLTNEEENEFAITQWEIVDALKDFDNTWEGLHPAEQRRIVGCLVDRMSVNTDGLDVRFRADGIRSLLASMQDK